MNQRPTGMKEYEKLALDCSETFFGKQPQLSHLEQAYIEGFLKAREMASKIYEKFDCGCSFGYESVKKMGEREV